MAKRTQKRAPSSKRSLPVFRFNRFGDTFNQAKNSFFGLKEQKNVKKTSTYLRSHPFAAFFTALGVLLFVIILGNFISNFGKTPEKKIEAVAQTKVYSIGEAPKATFQAEVNQEGVIEIVAQTSGIVQEVNVTEGQHVEAGNTLVSLSSNYQGGSTPGLQAQLAGAQYKNVTDTFDTQKDLINKQRQITEVSSNNTEELRKISEDAENDTSGLLDQNEGLLNALSTALELAKQNGNPIAIGEAETAKAGAQAGVNQLRNAFRNLEYATDTDNPPTQLSNLQKDISLKQLDIQEKALGLSKEASRIQYNIALIQASLMSPAAPFSGTVERILVTPGQNVNSGTVLAVISSDNPKATLSMLVPQSIAQNISRAEPSILHIGGKKVKATPAYVSNVATNKLLYSVLYNLPEEYINKVTDNSFISVEAPIGYANTLASVPFIPIDSIFQSQNSSYVFTQEKGKAKAREVELGAVYGSYVEITKGIKNGDKVILNRNVVAGEKVEVTQ